MPFDYDFKKMIGVVKEVKLDQVSSGFRVPVTDACQKALLKQKRIDASVDIVTNSDVPMVGSEEMVSFVRSDYSNKILKKLKKESYPVVLEIDLHSMTEAEAEKYLLKTLSELSYLYPVSIRVIHGKAKSFDTAINYPILKNMVIKILHDCHSLIAYVSCTPINGGSGATLVLLAPDGR